MLSLPPAELPSFKPGASIFDLDRLAGAAMSVELRAAIDLVARAASSHGVKLSFIARPEMFTEGASLAWLHERISGATTHISFSDGGTVKLIPGLENHAFFYRGQHRRNADALERLAERAPELIRSIRSQVNTAYMLRDRDGSPAVVPTTIIDRPRRSTIVRLPSAFYSFYWNRHSVDDSINWILDWGGQQRPFDAAHHLTYVALTEVALDDAAFLDAFGKIIQNAYLNPAMQLVIELPPGGGQATRDRLAGLFAALNRGKAGVPRIRPGNVHLAAEDCTAALAPRFASATMILHDSLPLWMRENFQEFGVGRLFSTPRVTDPSRMAATAAALTDWKVVLA